MIRTSQLRALILAALLAASSAEAAPPGAARLGSTSAGKALSLRLAGDPETFDWNRASSSVSTYLVMNLMEGLLTFDENFKVSPSLAERMTVSPDGKTYTFYLRKGVKWSDGVPLTAKDFVFSWKRLLLPATAASYAYFLYDVDGAEEFNKGIHNDFNLVGAKALDDHTFQVRLKRPVAHWLYIPTFWVTFPLREDIVAKHGDAWAKPGRMVTVGAFTLLSHDLGSRVIFRANPHYYGKKGNIDEIRLQIVLDDSTALNLYESGQLDVLTQISMLDMVRLSSNPELRRFPYLKVQYLSFMVGRYVVSSPRLRRAIAMSIDKSKITAMLHGGTTPATTFVPPQVLGHAPQFGLPYDPEGARKELKASGWDSTRKIKLELLTYNTDKLSTLSQFIQGEIKKTLGLEVEIQSFDHRTFRSQLELKNFPLALQTWGADYPDPDNFLSVFLSDAGNNRIAWKNAKYDQLVLAARTEKDQAKRIAAYREAQRILIEEEAAILPLFYENNVALIKSRVKNLTINPLNYMYLRGVSVQ
ncbi:MAG: peptide ABC transporter substrate-binding protein [Bdellovibrionales bacterium]|nr:peptide ABC transporter substrate-binding protein [Bdellovibrionales bacterium]